MQRVDVGFGLQQLHTNVAHGAHAGGAITPLVTAITGCNEEVLRRGTGRTHGRSQHQRRHTNQADRGQVLDRVVRHLGVQQLGNRHVAIDHQADGVVVGSLGHEVRGDVAPRAHLVLDDDRLAQHLGQRLGQRARRQVGRRACGEAHHDLERLVGPVRQHVGLCRVFGSGLRQNPRGDHRQSGDQGGAAKHGMRHEKPLWMAEEKVFVSVNPRKKARTCRACLDI